MSCPRVFINNVSVKAPETEVHEKYLAQAPEFFFGESKKAKVYSRLASKAQIDHRYSVLTDEEAMLGEETPCFYKRGNFPSTRDRMQIYQQRAWPLAQKTVGQLKAVEDLSQVTHVIVTSCTGFYAPGLDIQLVKELGLATGTERTFIGFMGCYAAINAMKQAYHTVRSKPEAKVLMLNLELCSLHLKESDDLEEMLAFLIFADGCAASLISTENRGLEISGFESFIEFSDEEKIQWRIGDTGFDMHLSQEVPRAIEKIAGQGTFDHLKAKELWAVHPGGRSILDAVEKSFCLSKEQMQVSRDVLQSFGNMSSATIMFVLEKILKNPQLRGEGCAIGFGPGLTTETMQFTKAPI